MSATCQILVDGILSALMLLPALFGMGILRRATSSWIMSFGALMVYAGILGRDFVAAYGLAPWGLPFVSGVFGCGLGVAFVLPLLVVSDSRVDLGQTLLVASIGAAMIADNILALVYGTETQFLSQLVVRGHHIGGVTISAIRIAGALVGVLTAGCIVILKNAIFFRVVRALDLNTELVSVSGWPVERVRVLVVVLSGALGGISGGFLILDTGLDAFSGIPLTLTLLAAVLVGGTQSMLGWVAGGFAIFLLQALAAILFATKWVEMSTFLIFIVVLIFREDGFISLRRRQSET